MRHLRYNLADVGGSLRRSKASVHRFALHRVGCSLSCGDLRRYSILWRGSSAENSTAACFWCRSLRSVHLRGKTSALAFSRRYCCCCCKTTSKLPAAQGVLVRCSDKSSPLFSLSLTLYDWLSIGVDFARCYVNLQYLYIVQIQWRILRGVQRRVLYIQISQGRRQLILFSRLTVRY